MKELINSSDKSAFKIDAVIFDMDGLMLDTENLTFQLYRDTMKEKNYDLTLELFKKTIGLRSADTKKIYEEYFGSEYDYDYFRNRNMELFWQVSEQKGIPKKKGLDELLEYLNKNNIPCAVATSTSEKSASRILKETGIYKFFDAFVYGDMIENGKPAPDIYLKAAELLSVSPENCIGIEDSYNGIKAVHSAGMKAVMIPDLLEPSEEIKPLVYRQFSSLDEVVDLLEEKAYGNKREN